MARSDRKRILLAALVLVILAVVLPPFINVNRYRTRLVDAISNALGRPVAIGAISLQLLPQPGFTITNFVVGDDPAFSAEPILRADEVRATLRMTSLWRGKLEIARLSLQYPSLNLVRNAQGKLNLESLLAHASRTPAAPTTARKPEARVRFPYIQANAGRINFKSGVEKTAFALGETDFALWSESEGEWRMRMEGKPLRTDTNVSDSGTLHAEGTFRRADNLRDTPLQLRFSLERGQLGQFTKLIYGRDRGWRGTAELSGTVSGTPANLQVLVDAAVQDFRRYDILRGEPIRLQAHCTGTFNSTEESLRDIECQAPAASGTFHAAGRITGLRVREYDLTLTAAKVPINWLVTLARHAKRDLPDDITALGEFSADFHAIRLASSPPIWTGTAQTDKFELRSETLGKDLSLGAVELSFPTEATRHNVRGIRGAVIPVSATPRLELHPFPVPMGATNPLAATGWISGEGYNVSLQGDAELERLVHVARLFGIGVPHFRATGAARISLSVVGTWKGFAQPDAIGTLQLREGVAEVPGIAQPVKIASATAALASGEIRMQNITASVEDIAFTGDATFPRTCERDLPCLSRWDLQIDEIDPVKLNALLNPRMKKRPWYRFFGGDREESVLARIEATGHLTARRLVLRNAVATRLSTAFRLQNANFTATDLRADFMGGTHVGSFSADFRQNDPVYTVSGTVSRLNLAQFFGVSRDPWATGTISGNYNLKMTGWTASDLASSASADAQVEAHDGIFRRILLDGRGTPLRFSTLAAKLALANGQIRIPESKLQTQSGIYKVSGTATFNRELALQMDGAGGTAYKVTGTLERPTVVAVPAREAEASLKK